MTIKNKFQRSLGVITLVGLFIRIFMSWFQYGFRYMDEHWQVLEPANHLVHGTWSITTEWALGLRSWIYPWLVSFMINIAEFLGIDTPLYIANFIRSCHSILNASAIPVTALLTYKILTEHKFDKKHAQTIALLSAWFTALWPFSIYCGFHIHGEMLGATLILFAIFSIYKQKNFIAGIFFGIAFAIKIDVAVAGAVCGLWFLLTRPFKQTLMLAWGALPFAFLVGFIDKLTWGQWFHSVLGHGRVNLVEHVGNQWGVSPWYQHFIYFIDLGSLPLLIALCALPFLWKKFSPHTRTTWVMSLGFVFVFSLIAHKEKRFLAPLLYTSIALSFALIPLVMKSQYLKYYRRPILMAATFLLGVHFTLGVKFYILDKPWHERILALHNAARIPGIEKMLVPQWPMAFYNSRKVPTISCGGEATSIRKSIEDVKTVSLAMEWTSLINFEKAGLKCDPWPYPPKPPKFHTDPMPSAYLCKKIR